MYVVTPKGIEEKSSVRTRFLKITRVRELAKKIEQLRREMPVAQDSNDE